MFGYIAINKDELKCKDFDIYHSYYCGLCRQLDKQYGKCGQVTLSYDMTFLIVFLTGLYEPDTEVSSCRCVAHPLAEHTSRVNTFTDYAAAMNLVLAYYKCRDDWKDDGKRKSYLAARLLHKHVAAIQKDYPEKVAVIASRLKKLSALEAQNEQNLDTMAGLFGEIMAEIFAWRKDEWETSLRRFGFYLGKFIYLMDAYEDVEADLLSNSYNPLKSAFKREDFAEYGKQILTMMMAECSREFEMLPIITHAEILRNVLYSGIWTRYTIVTAKRNSTQEMKHD